MNYLNHSFESPVIEHWGFGKGSQKADHKYIDRKWVNGKWQYIYNTAQKGVNSAKNFVGTKVTGSTYERDVQTNNEKASKALTFIGRNKYNKAAAESQATYNRSIAGKLNTKVSDLSSKGTSLISSGSNAIKSFGDAARSKVSQIKSSDTYKKGSYLVDRYITGKTASEQAARFNRKAVDAHYAGDSNAKAVNEMYRDKNRESYNNSVAGRLNAAGRAISGAYNRAVGNTRTPYEEYVRRGDIRHNKQVRTIDRQLEEKKKRDITERERNAVSSYNAKKLRNRSYAEAARQRNPKQSDSRSIGYDYDRYGNAYRTRRYKKNSMNNRKNSWSNK